jgi:hypothetical protein
MKGLGKPGLVLLIDEFQSDLSAEVKKRLELVRC